MEFKVASEEQRAKLEACNGPEDILALIKEEGYELTEEQLEAVSGGFIWDPDPVVNCPACHKNFKNPNHLVCMTCPHCGAYLTASL